MDDFWKDKTPHPAWGDDGAEVLHGFAWRVFERSRSLEEEERMWVQGGCKFGKDAFPFAAMVERAWSLRRMFRAALEAAVTEGPAALRHTFEVKNSESRAEVSLLGVACMLGDYAAGRLFVRHGADPDKGLVSYAKDGDVLVEPPLASVLAGAFPEDERLSPTDAQREAFCDWLAGHGAKVAELDVPWGAYAAVSMSGSGGGVWAARWLLRHGVPASRLVDGA